MEGREKPSWGVKIFAPLFFITGALAALLWFLFRIFDIFLGSLSEIEVFDKGSFYMLGVGVGLSILAFVTVQEGWIGKTLSKQQSSYLTKGALLGIALIFTTPHLVHYLANNYLTNRGYTICEDASNQWLFIRNIVYVSSAAQCTAE